MSPSQVRAQREEWIEQAAEEARRSMLADAQAEQPQLLRRYEAEHERDKALYSCRLERHGDFLAVFITRGEPPPVECHQFGFATRSTNKVVSAINLGNSSLVSFEEGRPPDLQATGQFHSVMEWDKATSGWKRKIQLRVADRRPAEWGRPMLLLDAGGTGARAWGYSMDDSDDRPLGVEVEQCARQAADDRIVFTGATLYVPHGLGSGLYFDILKAIARGWERPELGGARPR